VPLFNLYAAGLLSSSRAMDVLNSPRSLCLATCTRADSLRLRIWYRLSLSTEMIMVGM